MKNDSISVETQRRWLQGEPLMRSVKSGILISYPPKHFNTFEREACNTYSMQSYAYFLSVF